LAQKRTYLPRESLKNSLSQFLEANKATPPTQAFFGLRFLEKLLSYRLGGSVAQVVTKGFENWMQIRSHSADLQPLSSPELVFAADERLASDGSVVTALQDEDLKNIVEKLKTLDCKRICIHFLHAHSNPAHEQKAAAFFAAEGFEVFTPTKTDNPDEVSRWRKNLLNAAVSGTFTELKSEINEVLTPVMSADNIWFLNGEGKLFRDESPERLLSIFATNSAMSSNHTATNTDLLYLGLERFTLFSANSWTTQWSSPWGQVEAPQASSRDLKIQPTLAMDLNAFKHITFTQKNEGWEPGPMFMGRGQRPCLLDLWSENSKLANVTGLNDRVVATGVQRFKNALLALLKISRSKDLEVDHLIKDLQSLSLQSLVTEVTLQRKSDKLILAGPLAPLLANGFKKDSSVTILSDDCIESRALAVSGMLALGARA
jgi:N-methylhydantoinase A